MRRALAVTPDKMSELLALSPQIGALAERYRYMRDCVVLGRGYSYATAFEFALKMKELTYTIAEPYSSADFMHGPLALIEHGFPAFVVAPSGVLLSEMKQFVGTLKQREAEIIAISDDTETLALGRSAIPLPVGVPEWLSPLTGYRAVPALRHAPGRGARLRPRSPARAAQGDGDKIEARR
jgi:glucosamine--fructose-6-phosphate aminotransferase (isomerizing)